MAARGVRFDVSGRSEGKTRNGARFPGSSEGEARAIVVTVPTKSDKVHVKGRRGLFAVVSVGKDTAHLMALEGAPRVIEVPHDEIELAPEMKPRTYPDKSGAD